MCSAATILSRSSPAPCAHNGFAVEDSRLRAAHAGLYAWRAKQSRDDAEKERMLRAAELAYRQAFIEHLKQRGILAVFHYQPLHLSTMGRRFGGTPGACPVAEDVSDRLVRLPFFNDLTPSDQARVVDAVRGFAFG